MSDKAQPAAPEAAPDNGTTTAQEGGADCSAATPAEDTQPTTETASRDADLQRERDEYYDLLLRKTAEFDNYRKRIERERRELLETAGADILTELLPVIDDLERALEAEPHNAAARAYRTGVELIHGQLLDLLRRHRVTPIAALGADFDPHVHQAVAHEPTTRHRDGEVTAELRRGYRIGDRLLRAAMVKVAKRE